MRNISPTPNSAFHVLESPLHFPGSKKNLFISRKMPFLPFRLEQISINPGLILSPFTFPKA
jgi:hypothetical protein